MPNVSLNFGQSGFNNRHSPYYSQDPISSSLGLLVVLVLLIFIFYVYVTGGATQVQQVPPKAPFRVRRMDIPFYV
jgi:hypothetical protein